MAATRLIALHVNKGKTVAQCLADRTDYSQNASKTNDGEFISSYECDPKTADEEFLLSKRQYQHITGRQQKNNIIAYQIRQSFKPGEITPEEANQVGYETAMRWTKGKHAFIVATHIDKAHIHNHIIYNSTSVDCSRKFNNFFLSGLAVQKLSDRVCAEHGLSIITPKPYRERQKRTVFPKSEPSVTSFVKLSTRYSKRSPRVLRISFRLLLIWDSSIRMESSQRFGERNRSGLFVCVLLARDTVKKNSVPLSPGKACTSLRVVSGRLLNRSSSTFSLIFSLRWQREKRLDMNAGQRNTTVKKLPGQSAS